MPPSAAPLVAARDIGRTRVLAHLLGDHPGRLPAIDEALERMTAATATAEVPPDATTMPTAMPAVASRVITLPVVTQPVVAEAAAPDDARPFRKGDLVVYPTHGIGVVDHIRVEEIGGQKLNWIKISFTENRMSLRIPVRKARDIGLRRPVTRQAFTEVLAIIRGRPHANRIVWTKRALEYQGKINSGSVKALAEVVRDLRPAPDGSESSFSRRNLFESAIDRLAAEFAAVFRTDKAAAVDRLMAAPPPA